MFARRSRARGRPSSALGRALRCGRERSPRAARRCCSWAAWADSAPAGRPGPSGGSALATPARPAFPRRRDARFPLERRVPKREGRRVEGEKAGTHFCRLRRPGRLWRGSGAPSASGPRTQASLPGHAAGCGRATGSWTWSTACGRFYLYTSFRTIRTIRSDSFAYRKALLQASSSTQDPRRSA